MMICLNPYCPNCFNQIEFEDTEKCPECGSTKIGSAEMKKHQSKQLLEELKRLHSEEKLIEACVVDPTNIRRGS